MKTTYIKSSVGDVKLYKALVYEMPLTNEKKYDQYYVDDIQSYVFIWSYLLNSLTKRGDSDAMTHREVRNSLPLEIKQGEQYDLMLDVDIDGVTYLHDRYGTPENIINYVVREFDKDNVNIEF